MNYFLLQGNDATGPFALSQLRSMWASGSISEGAHFCQEGAAEWQPISALTDRPTMKPDEREIPQHPALTVNFENAGDAHEKINLEAKLIREAIRRDGNRLQKRAQLSGTELRDRINKLFRSMGIAIDTKFAVGGIRGAEDHWLELIVSTQESIANNYVRYLEGQDKDILELYPCQELVRISPSAVERDWYERWAKAGGKLYNGRMIAVKNSRVWKRLGDPMLFPDALGNGFPPFAFNSNMGVEYIEYQEALRLGVITELSTTPLPFALID